MAGIIETDLHKVTKPGRKRRTGIFILGMLVATAGVICGYQIGVHEVMANKSTVPSLFSSTPTDRQIEIELVRNAIQDAGDRTGLSKAQQDSYVQELDDACTKWRVPLILAATIASNESSFDPTAVHPPIFVRGRATRAIGFMGVVWEYNDSSLIKAKIATSKMELTIPRVNFEAGVFHIHNDLTEILARNPNLSEERVFDELVRRYYGGYNESYKALMVTKMRAAASQQWIRKVIRTIMIQYRQQPVKIDTIKTK